MNDVLCVPFATTDLREFSRESNKKNTKVQAAESEIHSLSQAETVLVLPAQHSGHAAQVWFKGTLVTSGKTQGSHPVNCLAYIRIKNCPKP